jgi:hypothetical protein
MVDAVLNFALTVIRADCVNWQRQSYEFTSVGRCCVSLIYIYTANALYRKFETNVPEMKLRGFAPIFYIHVSVSDLYIPTIGPQMRYSKQIHECRNWERTWYRGRVPADRKETTYRKGGGHLEWTQNCRRIFENGTFKAHAKI